MKRVLDLVFNKFHYKVLAFVFAVLLWLLATNKEITETGIRVSIKPIPTGNYEVIDYSPKEVELTVEGYRKDLLILREKSQVNVLLPKELNLKENGKGKIELKEENILLPVSSARVKKVNPEFIDVKVEKLIKKVVPVKLKAAGIRKNLKLILSPNYVIVYVPERRKNKVHLVKTEEIDLSSIMGNAEIYLNIVSKFRVEPDRVKLIIRRKQEGR
jgi:YbbR domain-containing protein